MPPEAREIMGRIVNRESAYRDQQYVVAECQALAAQLVAIVKLIEGAKADGQPDRDH